ncbi:MAG: FHA domain-containing protein [Pseudomonadota bacterium]
MAHDLPRLIVTSPGPLLGRTYALRPGDQLVGRGAAADLILDSPGLSRRHAYVSWDGRRASIEDADSRNGTIVNGTRVYDARPLRAGDIVRLGDLELRVDLPEADTTNALPAAESGPEFSNRFAGDNYGPISQAGRDVNIETRNEYRLEEDNPLDEIFQGRGLGRLLVAVGLLVALGGFAGWMYLIFSGGTSVDDPTAGNPFETEIFGLPAPMVAFGAFALGGIIAGIGVSMSKAARERERRLAQLSRRY